MDLHSQLSPYGYARLGFLVDVALGIVIFVVPMVVLLRMKSRRPGDDKKELS